MPPLLKRVLPQHVLLAYFGYLHPQGQMFERMVHAKAYLIYTTLVTLTDHVQNHHQPPKYHHFKVQKLLIRSLSHLSRFLATNYATIGAIAGVYPTDYWLLWTLVGHIFVFHRLVLVVLLYQRKYVDRFHFLQKNSPVRQFVHFDG